jgi:hypothetical protein
LGLLLMSSPKQWPKLEEKRVMVYRWHLLQQKKYNYFVWRLRNLRMSCFVISLVHFFFLSSIKSSVSISKAKSRIFDIRNGRSLAGILTGHYFSPSSLLKSLVYFF